MVLEEVQEQVCTVAEEAPRKKRKVMSGDRFLKKQSADKLAFLANIDRTLEEEKPATKGRNMKKKPVIAAVPDQESDDEVEEAMDYESKPRVQPSWFDQERREGKLPVQKEDGEMVIRHTSGGPRPFAEEPTGSAALSNKARRRITEQEIEEQARRDQRKKEKEAEREAKKKKPKKETEADRLIKGAKDFEARRRLMAVCAQRIAGHPEKEIELFDIFWAWEDDAKLGPMGLLSAVMVIRDLIPAYKISEKDRFKGVQLSRNVESLHKYEGALLTTYKKVLASLDKWRKIEPVMVYNAFAELCRVATHFNLSSKLINNTCKGATHSDPRISKKCTEVLQDVLTYDRVLTPTRDIVKAFGAIVKTHTSAKSRGGGQVTSITVEMTEMLKLVKLNHSERVAREDREIQNIQNEDLRKELEQGSINANSQELKKLEVEIMTDILVLYLRIMRAQNLNSTEVIVSVLRGVGLRAHEVNLELMIELLDEARGLVSHSDVALACVAVKCCFDLLAGPSAALTVDLSWLSDALIDVTHRAIPVMFRTTIAGAWPSSGDDGHNRLCEMILATINASLSCKQLQDRGSNNHSTARLVYNLFSTALNADSHLSMAALRTVQLIIFKYPKLKILFDADGMLFNANGSLKDTMLSLYWQQTALKHHVSPTGALCFDSMKLVISKDPRKSTVDQFAKLVNKPEVWIQADAPTFGERVMWPWEHVYPPQPQKISSKATMINFMSAADVEKAFV